MKKGKIAIITIMLIIISSTLIACENKSNYNDRVLKGLKVKYNKDFVVLKALPKNGSDYVALKVAPKDDKNDEFYAAMNSSTQAFATSKDDYVRDSYDYNIFVKEAPAYYKQYAGIDIPNKAKNFYYDESNMNSAYLQPIWYKDSPFTIKDINESNVKEKATLIYNIVTNCPHLVEVLPIGYTDTNITGNKLRLELIRIPNDKQLLIDDITNGLLRNIKYPLSD